jgi:thiamine-phosphate pyrophosphorylase
MNALPSRLLVVTDRHQAASPLQEIVRDAVAAGARWVWLRDRDMPAAERRGLATDLLAIVRHAGARLSIGGDVELAAELTADGVHLPIGASVIEARARLGSHVLIGASTHSEDEIAAASAGGADYVTLSPIFPSASKPGHGPALWIAGLAQASRGVLPVIALGGLTPARAKESLRAGAAGIAVMGEIMRGAGRPAGVGKAVTGFLSALRVQLD